MGSGDHLATPCPFHDCNETFLSINGVCNHLSIDHGDAMEMLDPSMITRYDLHICNLCNSECYTTEGQLFAHKLECRPPERTTCNTQLLEAAFKKYSPKPRLWRKQMTWLKKMKIEPMPYRMGLYSKIAENLNLKEELWNTGATLLQLVVDSSAKFTGKSRCRGDTNAVPIWRLLLIYQACVLHPAPPNRPVGETLAKIVRNRLLRFRQGNIRDL